nr:TonB-dependent receptor [Chitinophagaceae bacterium]
RWRGSDSIYGESIYTKRIEVIGSIPLALLGNSKFQYSVVSHNQNSAYGNTLFKANQNLVLTQLTKNLSFSRHDLLSGISLRYSHYDDNTIITKKTDGINNPEVVLLPGIFIQDDYSLFKKHKILAGIRYDYNSNHGHVFSPRFNWKYSINHTNTLRAGIGNGYRVVSLFSENHAAYSGAREIKIASKLKPEQSWNINLNYSTFLNYKEHLLAIETNVFATYFSNKIVADYFTDPNKIIFDNLQGYGITRGIGASLEWSSNWPIKAMLGITFVDLYLMNPDSVGNLNRTEQVHTPPISMNYLVSYTINKRNISIDISGNSYSPMLLPTLPFDYRPSHSPWFSIVNIQATKKWPKWEIYSGVKNLLNFIPKEDPIMRPMDPFDKNISDNVSNPYGYTFDPGYNYAPIQRTRVYFGIRYFLK